MSFNTKVKLVVLTSAVALAAAAPSAFAMRAPTSLAGFYTDADGTPDSPAATYSKQVIEKKVAPSNVAAIAAGKWQGDFYTEASGTPDAPAALFSKQVIEKQVAPSTSSEPTSSISVPSY